MAETAKGAQLERRLGLWDGASITIGAVIGTGIFLTTSDIARELPHAGWILAIWIAGGLLSLAGALTYGELGAMYPEAGGIYRFLTEAYGPLWGFLYGWGAFGVIMSGGVAAIAVGFGEYLGVFFPWFGSDHTLWSLPLGSWSWSVSGGQLAGVLAILFLTGVNHFGVRSGAGIQNVMTIAKIGAIGLFVVGALFVAAPVDPSYTTPTPSTPNGLLAAFGIGMIAALWTYDGWYGLVFSAGELKNPGRTLPWGLILGTLGIVAIYVALNLVYLHALPVAAMGATPRIGEAAAAVLFGASAAKALSAAIVVSTFGCLAATILYSSRIYQPMADDGVFFRAAAKIHPVYKVPTVSLWAQSLWAVLLTLSGTYAQLYTYVVFAGIVFHVATGAAVFVLRKKRPDHPRPYRAWGYPVVPALFIGASLLLLVNTLWSRPVESLLGTAIVVAGLPAYAFWTRGRRRAA